MAGNPILFSDPQGDTPGTGNNNGHTNQLVPPEGGGGTETETKQSTAQNQVKPISAGGTENRTSENRNSQSNGSRNNTKSIEISHVEPKPVQTSLIGALAPLAIIPYVVTVAQAVIIVGTMYYIVDQILKPRPKYVDNPSVLPTHGP